MKRITVSFFTLLFCFMVFGQQITYLTESQMSYDILHWHYDKYNNGQTSEWYKYTLDGVEYFGVKFQYEGDNYEAIYDSQGRILSEKKIMDDKNMPQGIIDVLDYRLVKYKIKEFVVETEFENRKEAAKNYKVDARTKTGGQVILWFDSQLNVVPEKKNQLAIR